LAQLQKNGKASPIAKERSEPDFFGGMKPCNLYKDNKGLEKVEAYLRLLM